MFRSTARVIPARLIATLLLVGFGIVASSTVILYNTMIATEIEKVRGFSQSQARLINAVAQFDAAHNQDYADGGARAATMSQVFNAHLERTGFGRTGEYVLGEIRDGRIAFLLPSRITGEKSRPVAVAAVAAEPMRRALLGESGVITALDYRGERVLAGFEPIPDLNAGFVAKIDIAEIREPFIKAATWGTLIVIACAILSGALYATIVSRCDIAATAGDRGFARFVRRRLTLFLLVGSIVFVGTAAAGSVIWFLFPYDFEKQKGQLVSLSGGLASLIGAVAEFDMAHSQGTVPGGVVDATISQVRTATRYNPGFGQTGEYVLGRSNGAEIRFLIPSRFTGAISPPVRAVGTKAEPMRRAARGISGVITDLDYRGRAVLAAFRPIKQLGVGLVAKMDLEEIRRPFFLTGIGNAGLTIFIVILGALLAPQILGETAAAGIAADRQRQPEGVSEEKGVPTVLGLLLVGAFATLILLMDILTPLGLAAGIPYIALIIIGAWFPKQRDILVLAVLATALVFVGFFLSPTEEGALWKAFTNRFYVILTIWLAAIILTRNKKAEEAVRKSEKRLNVLIESAPDAIVIADEEGVIRQVNIQTEYLFEYPREDLVGKSVEVLIPTGFRKKHVKQREDYMQAGAVRPMGAGLELLGQKMGGEEFPVEVNLSPIETTDGVHVVASVRDITERKRAEEDIRKLSRSVEQSPVSVVITDPEGAIDYVNPEFTKASGYTLEEAIGQNPRILNSGKVNPGIFQDMWRTIVGGGTWRGELLNRKKNGELYWEMASVSPIKNKEGKITHYLGVKEDITEQKALQTERDQAYEIIASSIEYASRIQRSVLPDGTIMDALFEGSLVIWEPRDRVGGDIYWNRSWGDGLLVILADCTGHGVPGAFMTLIATGALDRAQEEVSPGQLGKLVQRMHQLVQLTLGQHVVDGESDDGLELGACYLDSDLAAIIFCGARFEIFQVADREVKVTKGTKRGIGYRGISFVQEYEEFTLPVVPGTGYFLTTDGLIDQVGGEKRRSFGKKRFGELLLSIKDLPMALQRERVLQTLTEYQGEEIRRDDVSVIGFRVN